MKDRPKCAIQSCDKPALLRMFDNYYCGNCVAKMDRLSKVKQRNDMEEMLNGNE